VGDHSVATSIIGLLFEESMTFQCRECEEERPSGERVSVPFTFVHKMEKKKGEAFICTKCWVEGGLHEHKKQEMINELMEALNGKRW